jgi:hypothetical protein
VLCSRDRPRRILSQIVRATPGAGWTGECLGRGGLISQPLEAQRRLGQVSITLDGNLRTI